MNVKELEEMKAKAREEELKAQETKAKEEIDSGKKEASVSGGRKAKKGSKERQIVRTTKLEKKDVSRTVKRLYKERDRLRFDLVIQRNEVWTDEQKSLFIHSILYGYPFPDVFAEDKGDGNWWLLDGKQRLSTILSYVDNKFKLSKNTPSCFGYEISNQYFKDLHDDFQDDIWDTEFKICEMQSMTEEERDELFVRLNKGTALSKIEQIRAMYSKLFLGQVKEIANTEFFTDHVKIPDTRFANQEIIMQTALILDEDNTFKGIGSPQIQKYVEDLKSKGQVFSDELYDKFIIATEYLEQVCSDFGTADLKNILKKSTIPVIIAQSLHAVDDNIPPQLFAEFLNDFLIVNYDKDSTYGVALQSSSTKKESVIIRQHEMDKAYAEYMNKVMKLNGDKMIQSKSKELENSMK